MISKRLLFDCDPESGPGSAYVEYVATGRYPVVVAEPLEAVLADVKRKWDRGHYVRSVPFHTQPRKRG
jgi:hypothetical protein